MEKTYVIKVKADEELTPYKSIEQALYNIDAGDVDLLEVYDD